MASATHQSDQRHLYAGQRRWITAGHVFGSTQLLALMPRRSFRLFVGEIAGNAIDLTRHIGCDLRADFAASRRCDKLCKGILEAIEVGSQRLQIRSRNSSPRR